MTSDVSERALSSAVDD